MGEIIKFLSRDEIFNADDIEFVEINVPEWGGVVRLKTLTADQAIAFVDTAPEQRANLLPRLVCESAVNEKGEQLFKSGDHEKLKGKSLRAFMRLGEKLMALNGLGGMSAEDKKTGNVVSEALPGGSSTV